jgi:hypothetical protein
MTVTAFSYPVFLLSPTLIRYILSNLLQCPLSNLEIFEYLPKENIYTFADYLLSHNFNKTLHLPK